MPSDPSTPREGFKQLGEHIEDCHAAARPPAFIVHGGMDYNRKKNGHRGGGTGWHRFRCNDTDCEAVMLVRWDVLAKFIDPSDEDLS